MGHPIVHAYDIPVYVYNMNQSYKYFTEHLKTKLDIHISEMPKVRIIRLPTSQGLMASRQAGIDAASADVIVVMDSHMEVADGNYVM